MSKQQLIIHTEGEKPVSLQKKLTALELFKRSKENAVAIAGDAADVNPSNFTKLAEGENEVWLVQPPVYGSETYLKLFVIDKETGEIILKDDGNPKLEDITVLRFREDETISIPARYSLYNKSRPKPFIGLVWYNFKSKKIEAFTTSQSELFNALFTTLKYNKRKGNMFERTLCIGKKRKEKDIQINGQTRPAYTYSVTPYVKEDVPIEVLNALKKLPVTPDLDNLFIGKDPFEEQTETLVTDAEIVAESPQKQLAEQATAETRKLLK